MVNFAYGGIGVELLQSKETIDLDFKAFLGLSSVEKMGHVQIHGSVSVLEQLLSALTILSKPLKFLLEGAQLLRKRSIDCLKIQIQSLLLQLSSSFGLNEGILLWGQEDVFGLESLST